MIDHVMRFNLPAATAKMAELARVAGVPGGDSGIDRGARRGVHRLARRAEGRRSAFRRRCRDYAASAPVTRGRHSGAGRRRDRRHLPPDQSAAVHARGFRAHLRRGDLDGRCCACSRSASRRASSTSDPQRAIFKGMTLQYIEQNVAHWLMQRDVLAFMVPSPDGARGAPAQRRDGSTHYAQRARRPGADGRLRRRAPNPTAKRRSSPHGTAIASATTTRSRCCDAFVGAGQAGARHLPRRAGHQRRARRHAVPGHRHAGPGRAQPSQLGDLRAELPRDVARARHAASRSSIPAHDVVKTNSIHHQAVKDLGRDLVVEAWSEPDRIVEAMRWHGPELRVRRAVASRNSIAPGDRVVHRRHADPRRLPRRRARAQGRRVRTLSRRPTHEDHQSRHRRGASPKSPPTAPRAVRRKYERARAAQPRWAARADAASASTRSRSSASASSRRSDDARAAR